MTLLAIEYVQRRRTSGILKGDTVYWYWIGKHDEHDRIAGAVSLRER